MLADERGQKMLAVRDNIKRTKEVSESFSKTKSHNDLFIFSSLLRNQINFKVLKKITKTKKKKKLKKVGLFCYIVDTLRNLRNFLF